MKVIFEYYKFDMILEKDNKMVFSSSRKSIVSYFILNFIDCCNIGNDEGMLKEELWKLEKEYFNEEEKRGFIYSIIDSFQDKQEVSQIDKNTSAIYLVRFAEENMLTQYRNIIYSIEESPNYFRRYILPYTEKQVIGLKDMLLDYKDKNIVEVLTDLADDENNYYSLMDSTAKNSVYELVIKLFSKVPFLQYKFKEKPIEISLEKMVSDALTDELQEYDQAINANQIELEELIALEREDISENEINDIINKLLEEAM